MFDQGLFNECLVKYKSDFCERFSDERYKWEAAKWFQTHWDINAENYYQMFTDNCVFKLHSAEDLDFVTNGTNIDKMRL